MIGGGEKIKFSLPNGRVLRAFTPGDYLRNSSALSGEHLGSITANGPAYDDPALPDVPVVANNLADMAAVLTDPRLGGLSADSCVTAPARQGRP